MHTEFRSRVKISAIVCSSSTERQKSVWFAMARHDDRETRVLRVPRRRDCGDL